MSLYFIIPFYRGQGRQRGSVLCEVPGEGTGEKTQSPVFSLQSSVFSLQSSVFSLQSSVFSFQFSVPSTNQCNPQTAGSTACITLDLEPTIKSNNLHS